MKKLRRLKEKLVSFLCLFNLIDYIFSALYSLKLNFIFKKFQNNFTHFLVINKGKDEIFKLKIK